MCTGMTNTQETEEERDRETGKVRKKKNRSRRLLNLNGSRSGFFPRPLLLLLCVPIFGCSKVLRSIYKYNSVNGK